MADTNSPTPMTDADVVTPPNSTSFTPAEPLKDQGVSFQSDNEDEASSSLGDGRFSSAKQVVKDKTADLRGEAGEKARGFVEDGKARAAEALQQVSTMLNDAAAQVDGKLGEQYGQYARAAATKVDDLTAAIDGKSVEDLLEDARGLVRTSPAIAIGAAAAVGFVVARLLGASIDQRSDA